MAPFSTCPRCGAPRSNAAQGLCAACLLVEGLEETGADGSVSPGPGRFGDYELLEEIARGGMGVVYRARQVNLNRIVAVKMILGGGLAGARELQRFRVEAETAARLRHPNIVAIHDVGESDGQPFFSMDLIEGRSLAELARREPIPARQAAQLLKTVAEAVQYAHSRGVLHRDLKPSNILIDRTGQPHVTDFGLAKQLPNAEHEMRNADLTVSGQVLGSPNFMPPEQAAGSHRDVGASSDVYSLGAILYQLLTGRAPFAAETVPQTLRLVAEADPVAPRLLNPVVPRDLETICLKCMAKEPGRRYPTAQHLADELGHFLRDEPILARPIGRAEKFHRWARRHPLIAALTGVVGLLLFAVAIISTVAAARLNRANHEGQEKLRDAYLSQARANRWSGRPGRRFESLKALKRAAEIRPSLDLRNEAINSLPLVDISPTKIIEAPSGTRHIAFDGRYQRYVRSDESGNVVVRQLADDQTLLSLSNFPSKIDVQALSLNGSLLAVGTGDSPDRAPDFRVIEVESGQTLFQRTNVPIPFAMFTGNGRYLITLQAPTTDGARPLVLFDMVTRSECWTNFGPDGWTSFNFLPFSMKLANVDLGSVKSTSLESPLGQISFWTGRPNDSSALDVSNSGELLAAGGREGRIQIWDMSQRPLRTHAFGQGSDIVSLHFNPRGNLLLSTSGDSQLRVWETTTGKQLLSKLIFPGPRPCFSPDGRWLACSVATQQIELCEVSDGRECVALNFVGPARSCAFSPHYQLVVSAHEEGARLWNSVSGRLIALVPSVGCEAARFADDGRLLLTGGDSGLKCWRITPLQTSNGAPWRLVLEKTLFPGQKVGPVQLDAAGRRATVIVNREIQIVDIPTGQSLRKFKSETQTGLSQAALSPDGRLCVGQRKDATDLWMWDVETGAKLPTPQAREITGLSFRPDGLRSFTYSSGHYACWDTATWKNVWRIPRVSSAANPVQMTWSPDGKTIAVSHASYSVKLMEAGTGVELGTFETPDSKVINDLAFSPDGEQLAVATTDSTIHLWNFRLVREELRAINLDWETTPFTRAASNLSAAPSAVEALQISVPPRDANCGAGLIDLTAHFNASFEAFDRVTRVRGNNLSGLPTGRQIFKGTEFDVRGIVQVGLPEFGPAVRGIAIGQKCRSVSFLHSALFLSSRKVPRGATVAEYVIHWADGETARVPVQHHVHLADWWGSHTTIAALPHLLDTNTTTVAWHGTNGPAARVGTEILIYKYRWNNQHRWDNPRPDVPIASIDFEAVNAAPFLIAITVE